MNLIQKYMTLSHNKNAELFNYCYAKQPLSQQIEIFTTSELYDFINSLIKLGKYTQAQFALHDLSAYFSRHYKSLFDNNRSMHPLYNLYSHVFYGKETGTPDYEYISLIFLNWDFFKFNCQYYLVDNVHPVLFKIMHVHYRNELLSFDDINKFIIDFKSENDEPFTVTSYFLNNLYGADKTLLYFADNNMINYSESLSQISYYYIENNRNDSEAYNFLTCLFNYYSSEKKLSFSGFCSLLTLIIRINYNNEDSLLSDKVRLFFTFSSQFGFHINSFDEETLDNISMTIMKIINCSDNQLLGQCELINFLSLFFLSGGDINQMNAKKENIGTYMLNENMFQPELFYFLCFNGLDLSQPDIQGNTCLNLLDQKQICSKLTINQLKIISVNKEKQMIDNIIVKNINCKPGVISKRI